MFRSFSWILAFPPVRVSDGPRRPKRPPRWPQNRSRSLRSLGIIPDAPIAAPKRQLEKVCVSHGFQVGLGALMRSVLEHSWRVVGPSMPVSRPFWGPLGSCRTGGFLLQDGFQTAQDSRRRPKRSRRRPNRLPRTPPTGSPGARSIGFPDVFACMFCLLCGHGEPTTTPTTPRCPQDGLRSP